MNITMLRKKQQNTKQNNDNEQYREDLQPTKEETSRATCKG
jgi:hypothetical protein